MQGTAKDNDITMKDGTPNYYSVIPANVRYDKDLSASMKLFYGEISALAQKDGYCWASSNYFETLYGVTRKCIYNWTNKLAKKGYIRIEYLTSENGSLEGRKIFLTPEKIDKVPEKKSSQSPEKKSSRKQYKSKQYECVTAGKPSDAISTSQFEYTTPEAAAVEQELDRKAEFSKILKVYDPSEYDPNLIRPAIIDKQSKLFYKFTPEERVKIIEWFSKYSVNLKMNKVWLSGFFTDKKDLDTVANYFRGVAKWKQQSGKEASSKLGPGSSNIKSTWDEWIKNNNK